MTERKYVEVEILDMFGLISFIVIGLGMFNSFYGFIQWLMFNIGSNNQAGSCFIFGFVLLFILGYMADKNGIFKRKNYI